MTFYNNAFNHVTLWTEEQLQEVLYHGDNNTSPVIEYPPPPHIIIDNAPITITNNNNNNNSMSNNTNETDSTNTISTTNTLQLPPNASYIVEFYSPWCPHCQHYKPQYIRLARQVSRRSFVSTDTLIYFIAVSCTLHSDICTHYDIEGFPTLMAWGPNVVDHDNSINSSSSSLGVESTYYYTNISIPGLILDSPTITPEYIATILGIELTPSLLSKELKKDKRIHNVVGHTTSNSSSSKSLEGISSDGGGDDDDGKVMDDYYNEEITTPSPKEALHLANKAILEKIHSYQYLFMPISPPAGYPMSISSRNKKNQSILWDTIWLQTKNYRFYDIAKSLTFLLQNALTLHIQSSSSSFISTSTTTKSLGYNSTVSLIQQQQQQQQQQMIQTFMDFLFLLDWTLPPTWHLRTELIHDLLTELDTMSLQSNKVETMYKEDGTNRMENHTNIAKKEGLKPFLYIKQKLIQMIQNRSNSSSFIVNTFNITSSSSNFSTIPWGFISPTTSSIPYSSNKWSSLCTHVYDDRPSLTSFNKIPHDTLNQTISHQQQQQQQQRSISRTTGYTCGLWELFHTLTIGASLPQQQIYGHLMGYKTSSYHIAQSIKQVIEFFFGCDVCRKNFVTMYDNCGHNHCTRFPKPLSLPSFIDNHPRRNIQLDRDLDRPTNEGKDLVIWLWEVHNEVNIRLMNENAQREKRSISRTETLAGKFPTKLMCPSCWRDLQMKQANYDQVYTFLKELYWPGYNLPVTNGRLWLHALDAPRNVHPSRINVPEQPLWSYREEEGGEAISTLGLLLVCLPFLFVTAMLFARKLMSTESLLSLTWTNSRKRDKRN